jgi:hypothetical protein
MSAPPMRVREESIPVPGTTESLWATFLQPAHSRGVVLFAHGATAYVRTLLDAGDEAVGYFGASTGAAAALIAAADPRNAVSAVVSGGGRPDLAGDALAFVKAPTLLIVGGEDRAVVELNREARATMHLA